MNENDNCATVLEEIPENTQLEINEKERIEILQKIPYGHKFALKFINKSDEIIKYSQVIGIATTDIKKGDWIHTHNIKSAYLEAIKSA